MDLEPARHLSEEWLAAWNRHDLEAIMGHYGDPIEFVSPRVVTVLGRVDGTIRSRDELRAYFRRGLATQPGLRFTLVRVLVGPAGWTICYTNHRGQHAAEAMFVGAAGKVARAIVHYDL